MRSQRLTCVACVALVHQPFEGWSPTLLHALFDVVSSSHPSALRASSIFEVLYINILRSHVAMPPAFFFSHENNIHIVSSMYMLATRTLTVARKSPD